MNFLDCGLLPTNNSKHNVTAEVSIYRRHWSNVSSGRWCLFLAKFFCHIAEQGHDVPSSPSIYSSTFFFISVMTQMCDLVDFCTERSVPASSFYRAFRVWPSPFCTFATSVCVIELFKDETQSSWAACGGCPVQRIVQRCTTSSSLIFIHCAVLLHGVWLMNILTSGDVDFREDSFLQRKAKNGKFAGGVLFHVRFHIGNLPPVPQLWWTGSLPVQQLNLWSQM